MALNETIQKLIDNSSVALTAARLSTGSFPLIAANARFRELTGYREEEILGRDCKFLQGPLTNGTDVKNIGEMLRDDDVDEGHFFITNYTRTSIRFENYLSLYKFRLPNPKDSFVLASQFDLTKAKEISDFDSYSKELTSDVSSVSADTGYNPYIIMEGAKLISKTARTTIKAKIAMQ